MSLPLCFLLITPLEQFALIALEGKRFPSGAQGRSLWSQTSANVLEVMELN